MAGSTNGNGSATRTKTERGPAGALPFRDPLSPWLAVAALMGGLAVALGAFGAHGLEGLAASWPEENRLRRLENWEVGARYQMYHALAMIGVAFHLLFAPRVSLHIAAALFLVGTSIFSGCLYAYTLTGARFWGAIVPLGGIMLIAAWGTWCVASLARSRPVR